MDDESYQSIFQPVMGKVMETYRPEAVVLQCGADSLAGDRLGCFNLTLKGSEGDREGVYETYLLRMLSQVKVATKEQWSSLIFTWLWII